VWSLIAAPSSDCRVRYWPIADAPSTTAAAAFGGKADTLGWSLRAKRWRLMAAFAATLAGVLAVHASQKGRTDQDADAHRDTERDQRAVLNPG
jgi:hypothetical protein